MSNEEQEQPQEETKPTYDQLYDYFSQPAINVYPTPLGDVNFGSNIVGLDLHRAMAYLQVAITKISLELLAGAEQTRAQEQQRAERYATKIVVPGRN